jgi:ribonuclease R
MKCPDPHEIVEFLTQSDSPMTKRDLARAFGVKGDARIPFKRALRQLESEGLIVKQGGGAFGVPDSLPAVTVIEVTDVSIDGDVFAVPANWNEDVQGKAPRIEIIPDKKKKHSHALASGQRALVRLKKLDKDSYEGRIIRRLDAPENRVMGMIKRGRRGYILQPTDKRAKYEFDIAQEDLNDAVEHDLAVGEVIPARGLRNKKVRIVEVIGQRADPKAISLISMYENGLKPEFPKSVEQETKGMKVPELKKRTDLRKIPLVTIDGADARDFDDAVYAEALDNGGHYIIVAIADVAHYVTPHNELNVEAYRRGNSTYFPDRVVPMLPEALSNDLCSLRPKENRACMAMHMWIDADGKLTKCRIDRGLMRSAARLIYEQVQAAMDGQTDDTTGPLMDDVIKPLYAAYETLWKAREKRGALDLDLPERQIMLDEKNNMTGVRLRVRLDAHKMIEEFMILANVAAAKLLEDKKAPCVYRVHDKPDPAKLDSAREFIEAFGLSLPKGQVTQPRQLNQILGQAAELPNAHMISEVVLRTQSQARYDPANIGHFGLALQRYAHFTSPIRRYADLLVHRSLIRAYGLGEHGLDKEEEVRLEEMSQHISETERASMNAERSAVDRFTAAFLSSQIGAQFEGRIRGVTRAGLFVELAESGADGLVPMRSLPKDYYIHDEKQHALIGRDSGRVYRLGAQVRVQLREADGLTGSTILELTDDKGADIPGMALKVPSYRGRKQDNRGQKNKKGEYRKFAKKKFKGRKKK